MQKDGFRSGKGRILGRKKELWGLIRLKEVQLWIILLLKILSRQVIRLRIRRRLLVRRRSRIKEEIEEFVFFLFKNKIVCFFLLQINFLNKELKIVYLDPEISD